MNWTCYILKNDIKNGLKIRLENFSWSDFNNNVQNESEAMPKWC